MASKHIGILRRDDGTLERADGVGVDAPQGVVLFASGDLPPGVTINTDGPPGYYKQGGRVWYFGAVIVAQATMGSEYTKVLPAIAAGYEPDDKFHIATSLNQQPVGAFEQNTYLVPTIYLIYDGTLDGGAGGWAFNMQSIPGNAAYTPANDIVLVLNGLNYPLATP